MKDLPGPGAGIEAIAFSEDGKLLAGGDDDGNILIWSMDSGLHVMAVSAADQVVAVKFTRDRKRLVSLTPGSLDVWSVPDGKKLSESLSGSSNTFLSMALSPNGDYIAVSSQESSLGGLKTSAKVSLRAIDSAGILKTFDSGDREITALAFDPTGTVVMGASISGNIMKWATMDGRVSNVIKIDPLAPEDKRYYLINSIAFDPATKKILIARGSYGFQDGSLSIWDSATASKLVSFERPAEETTVSSGSTFPDKIGDPKLGPIPKAPEPGKEMVYSGRAVTTKARIMSKPEPQYTERARMQGVIGTVVLKGVLSSTGEMTNIHVIVQLPFGLTSASIRAAKSIKFTPATKDGKDVSQYIQIEYNYNLY
jgi:TonB family protein